VVTKQLAHTIPKYWDKILIFIFPIILTSLNSNWIFSPIIEWLPDQWFYLGYFRYFYDYAPEFPSNTHYFVERITWNVPGFYIYRIFPPLQANYVLHLLVYYLAVFSLYGTLHILFNRRAAILTAVFLGGYPWFLRAAGWDYVDGVGIAQMLLLIYVLTVSRHSRQQRLLLFFAGIVHTSLIITNLFWLGFAPSWVIYFLFNNLPLSWEKMWKLLGDVSYFLLGTLAMILVTMIFYHAVTGNYNFLQNSLTFSTQNSFNENIVRFIMLFYRSMLPFWHLLPAVIGVGAIWRLIKSARDIYYNSFVALVLLFVSAYGWLTIWHVYALPYLNVFLYSSFVIPASFLLLGSLFASLLDDLSTRQFIILIISTLVLLICPFYLVVVFPTLETLQGNTALIIFFSLVFITMSFLHPKRVAVLPVIISLAALSFLAGLNSYVLVSDPLRGRDNFMAIINSSNVIDSSFPDRDYTDFRLWYREDKYYDLFFNLSALYLYPWGSAIDHPRSGETPSSNLSIHSTDEFHDGDHIVIISSNPNAKDVIAEANRAVAARDAMIILESASEIREGSMHFTLYFTKVKVRPNT